MYVSTKLMSVELTMRAQHTLKYDLCVSIYKDYQCDSITTLYLRAYLIIENGKEKYQRFFIYYNSEWHSLYKDVQNNNIAGIKKMYNNMYSINQQQYLLTLPIYLYSVHLK